MGLAGSDEAWRGLARAARFSRQTYSIDRPVPDGPRIFFGRWRCLLVYSRSITLRRKTKTEIAPSPMKYKRIANKKHQCIDSTDAPWDPSHIILRQPTKRGAKALAFASEGVRVISIGGEFLALHACADGEANEIAVLGAFKNKEAACAACVNRFYAGIEKRNRRLQGRLGIHNQTI